MLVKQLVESKSAKLMMMLFFPIHQDQILCHFCYIFDLACNVLIQPKLLEHCTLTIRGVSTIYHTLY